MDKTCLQDHVGKIRAALCDKGVHTVAYIFSLIAPSTVLSVYVHNGRCPA